MKKSHFEKVFADRNAKTKTYLELLPDTDDLALVILKGHLIIEELLYSILEEHCKQPEYLTKAQLRFPQLLQLVRATVITPLPEEAYLGILELNNLRNSLAHKLKPKDVKEKMERLFKYSILGMADNPVNFTKPVDEVDTARKSISLLMQAMAVLSGIEELLRER